MKKIISFLLIFVCFLSFAASASVIGTEVDSYSIPIGQGTVFTHTTSFSEQSGVGKQTENYLVYEPNDSIKPIITYGDYLYGADRTTAEIKSLLDGGRYPVAGANADFFSLQTGVPMSNLIIDGKIVSKDATEQYGIGFYEDGSAFMSKFTIFSSMVKEDGTETLVYNINKYRQPYSIYMMTDEFSTETQNTSIGVDVILSVEKGDMILGTEMTAVVESVTENEGSIPIPEGKILLTVDNNAPTEFYESLASLQEGEKVTFKFGVIGDPRWKEVSLGMGATGGMLLEDGEINPELEKGSAPRTALGITEDGKIVLYTIDGRQSGYSYGVQLSTLAQRMKELGCKDAINLDGGGSTTFVAALPGQSQQMVNIPSDGGERKVSTFFLFENTEKPTGKAKQLFIYPRTSYLLKGAEIQLETKAVDENFYPAELTGKINYTVEKDKKSTITEDGVFKAEENGQVKVTAKSGDLSADIYITCLETPTDIHLVNADTGKTLTQLDIKRGETVNLTAEAYAGYNKLMADHSLFDLKLEGDIGTLSGGGAFTATDAINKEGAVVITAGEKEVSVPVKITKNGKETEDDLRILVECEYKDGILEGTLSNKYGLSHSEIKIFADGNEINAEEKDKKFTAQIPENTHKITVYVVSEEGYTTVKYIYADDGKSFENPFADTTENWAKDILSYMYGRKIISGENTDMGLLFRPQKEMTRAEFAVMCCNYLKVDLSEFDDKDMPFADEDTIPDWAKKQVKALYYKDVLKGRADGGNVVADPMNTITRAEAATIISRLLPTGMKKADLFFTDEEEIPSWALDAMKTLVSAGAINGYNDGRLKPLGKLTKAEAAKLFYSVI